MKKIIIILLILAAAFAAASFLQTESSGSAEPQTSTLSMLDRSEAQYPLYHTFDEEGQKIYGLLYDAMEQYDEGDVLIGVYGSREDLDTARDWIDDNFRQIVYEQPDFFWVNPYYYTVKEIESRGTYRLFVTLSYVADEEDLDDMQEEYEEEVERIAEEAGEQPTLFEQVLYVHDEILSNVEYDKDLMNESDASVGHTAYGCLVQGKTVCSGYTLAFTSVMQKLGIICGAEFNTYEDFSISDGHVWNYCKLEDEYYYFDLTWDDTCFDADEYKEYLDFGHVYFAVTEEELSKSNFTIQDDAPTPDCNGTEYNYFVYTGANISVYDKDDVEDAILAQKDNKYIALRFDDYGELLRAESALIDDGDIYGILGIERVSYVISNSSLHLYIFPK